MRNWRVAAVAAQLLLLLYFDVIEWVDPFPWNDIRRGNDQAGLDVFLGVALAVGIVAVWRGWGAVLYGAIGVHLIWALLQIVSWWIPYVRGASPMWQRVYARNFAVTTHRMTPHGTHVRPDASRLV